jgi:protein-tyrosine phosphatase
MFQEFSNMGEFYLSLVRHKEFSRRVVEALKIIAEPENHPLVFHCAVGKDRTGILAAIVLSILGVADADIIEDYTLTAPYMEEIIKRMNNNPETAKIAKQLPGYFWKAVPESMALFLSTLQREYGSVRGYVEAQGAEASLSRRLKKSLLT